MTAFRERHCLVTGCGFVGSHLVDALLDAGGLVRVASLSGAAHLAHPNLDVVQADLTRIDDCVRVATGMDDVFHAAGTVGAAGVLPTSAMAGITLNLTLTANMLQAAWQVGVKRIQVYSSSTGYPVVSHPVNENEFWEGEPYPGYFGYGWMRRYIERLGEYVSQSSGVGVSIVRPGALYGPRDNFDPKTSHVIAGLIRRAIDGEEPFVVWGDGKDVRDIMHIRDFARGCLLALDQKADCDPVNISAGKGITTGELAAQVLEAVGRGDEKVVFDPSRPTALPYRVLNARKAQERLGFSPQISLGDGLRETVSWLREKLA
tara:strand:+ start:6492 stop:7445 length:954 start_codon:yes stop_codon:yes gene_type:complete